MVRLLSLVILNHSEQLDEEKTNRQVAQPCECKGFQTALNGKGGAGLQRDSVFALLFVTVSTGVRRNWAGDEQGLITGDFFITLTLTNPLFTMKYPCSSPASPPLFSCQGCFEGREITLLFL